jgi:hypothetical protein
MRPLRSVAAGLTLLGVLGLSLITVQVQAQRGARGQGERQPLDSKAVTVRLLLGVGDNQLTTWDGKVALDQGEVVGIEGLRFRQSDEVKGNNAWSARTGASGKAAGKKAAAKKKAALAGAQIVPNGVFIALKAPDEARLSVETRQGNFTVALADLAEGAPRRYLEGRVEAQLVPTAVTLFNGPDQEDFPSAAADTRGNVWVACVVHQARGPATLPALQQRPGAFAAYVPKEGGDQVQLLRFADGKADDAIEVTGTGRDVWRPAVAVDDDGAVIVVWSENQGGNWDLFARTYIPGKRSWSEPKRLTRNLGTDTDAVLATAPDGKVWMAWQSFSDGQADILLAPVDEPSASVRISESPANEWSPALAIDKSGRIHVAYDTYQAGNYDIMLRSRSREGTLTSVQSVTSSPRFEARPSVAADSQGRVWVAYEERTPDWGKDFGALDGDGTPLYRTSSVKVRCVDGERLLDAPDPVAGANLPLQAMNSFPRISADRSGRIWLVYRHRQEARNSAVGGAWLGYVTSLAGKEWTVPAVLPGSDGMLDNRAAIVVPNDGPLLSFYDGDGRYSHEGDTVDHGLHVAALVPPGGSGSRRVDPGLTPAAREPVEATPELHPNEAADVAKMRAHRIELGGKTYQLLRGEFHRHTEISGDGGGDGALEDLWRYALDVANLDWIGNGDHDNGGGKEYTWWLIQKTTDLYHVPPRFTPMFTYERSVQYPHGHRNVMWAKRGIRTLPRLQDPLGGTLDDDAKMLYDYLKELDGICASHTSATNGMGTDWRDNDPKVEPFVEIYQGDRNSYEHLGAPRVARRASEAVGGFQPYGMVWNALALQYKFGFQSSSDHISTHISYGVAIAEDHSRAAILDAFKKRHCYAATDNILLDVRCGDHLMGDEFDTEGPVRLKVMVHGTRPITRVDIVKDFGYVYSTEPRTERVAFEWMDEERRASGLSWYYVRAIQDNGELAWGSPFWIHRRDGGRNTTGE